MCSHSNAIHERTISAVEIAHDPRSIHALELSVVPRGSRSWNHNLAIRVATYSHEGSHELNH